MINHINEIIVGEQAGVKTRGGGAGPQPQQEGEEETGPTWINEIFQGILTSETRCLNCETITSKDEEFCDLSIDVDQVEPIITRRLILLLVVQNTSVTSCLRNFSSTETLCSDNKFKCDTCSSYQVSGAQYWVIK